MAVMTNSIELMYRAQDHASRIIGNINTSLGAQLSTFMQLGMKLPIVGRNMSAAMTVATLATERYVRELKEMRKYTDLNTKTLIASQHAIEQSGARYDSLARFVDKIRDAQHKSWKVESQILITKLKMHGILDKEKGIMMDMNEIIKKSSEEILKYKEGYDRLRFAQQVFGDEEMAGVLERQGKAMQLAEKRGEDFVKLMELSEKLVSENEDAISELTMVFKDFGVRVMTIVLPVLTILVGVMTMTMKIFIFITKPIFAFARAISSAITYIKEYATTLYILGKVLIWVGTFALGFYVSWLIKSITAQIAAKVSATALGGQYKILGNIITWVGDALRYTFAGLQTLIMDTNWKKVLTGMGAAFKWVGNQALAAVPKIWAMMLPILKIAAVAIIAYQAFNWLARGLLELRYQFAKLFSNEDSNRMKALRAEINSIQKDFQAWSVEGIFKRLKDGLTATTEAAKENKKQMKETYDIAEHMYDSLGDTLERAINLPSHVIPSLMERMRSQDQHYKSIQNASKAFRGTYEQTMGAMPTPALERAQNVNVTLDQKVEFGDFGEPQIKTLKSMGLAG